MELLYKWLEEHNTDEYFVYPHFLEDIHNSRFTEVVNRMAKGHRKQYYRSGMGSHVLRPSMLGKPAAYVAAMYFLKKLDLPKEDKLNTVLAGPGGGRTKFIMWMGDMFEAWALEQFMRLGYKVHDKEKFRIRTSKFVIPGHIDFMLSHEEDDHEPFIIDTKLTNTRYFDYVGKFGLDDDRGYLTQMAIYSAAFKWCRVGLLYGDRTTGRLMLVEPHMDDLTECYNRAMEVCSAVAKCKRFNDIYRYIDPPEPVPEIYRGAHTGKYLLPYQMKGIHQFFYDTVDGINNYGDKRVYVRAYNYPDSVKEYEPEMPT